MYIKHDKENIGILRQLEQIGCGKIVIQSIQFHYTVMVDDINLLNLSEWHPDGVALHFCSILQYLLERNDSKQAKLLERQFVNLENILQSIFNGTYCSQHFSQAKMEKYSFTFTPVNEIGTDNSKFQQLIRFLEAINVKGLRCIIKYDVLEDNALLEQKARNVYELFKGRWVYYKGMIVQISEHNGSYYYNKDCSFVQNKSVQKHIEFPISQIELVCLHHESSGI